VPAALCGRQRFGQVHFAAPSRRRHPPALARSDCSIVHERGDREGRSVIAESVFGIVVRTVAAGEIA